MKKKIFLCLCFGFVVFAAFLIAKAAGFSVSQPSPEQMLAAAQRASAKTDIRPALLLGLFGQETSFGARLGKTRPEWEVYCQKPLNQYKNACIAWKNKDCLQDYTNAKGFPQICAALSYSTDEVKTSQTCALGFMQIEPATWLDVQSKHSEIRNPWDINDAFLAAGYYLAELDGTVNEEEALRKYYCGPVNFHKITCGDYAQQVLKKASQLAEFAAGLGPLPPLPTFPLPITPYELQLEYPEWFKLEPGMSLAGLVATIFNLFLFIAGATAFLMLSAGGFRYLTSLGDPSKMADAKDQIFNALLGLVLLLSSFLILNTVNPELVRLTEPVMEGLITAPEPEPPTLPTFPEIKAITPINLDQAISDVIQFLKTKNVAKAMTDFAASANERSAGNHCKGHNCKYQFTVEREIPITVPSYTPCTYPDENCCLLALIPFLGKFCFLSCTAQGCPGGTETIIEIIVEPSPSPPLPCVQPLCNNTAGELCPEPNAENGINQAISLVETAVSQGLLTEGDKLKLRLAEDSVNNCISDKGKILFPCSYAKSTQDWLGPIGCDEARDFYCIWAEGEETKYEKISFPIEPLKQAYEAIDKLVAAADNCRCENVKCSCSPPVPAEKKVGFSCSFSPGCETKTNLSTQWQCEAPCDSKNESSPFPPDFTQIKGEGVEIAGPKPGEGGPDGLRQFYTTLAAMTDQAETASQGQGLYLCEDIKSMLGYNNTGAGYLWTASPDHCPGYDVFPCCPTTPDLIEKIKGCGPIDFFVCGEVTGGPVLPTTCAGTCKNNPCATYDNCSALTGACTTGYCCQGSCTEAPAGPPWPMVCDTVQIPDCSTGLIQSSKQWEDATQALKDLIECIYTDPDKGAPINPGPISSISDANIKGRGGNDSCPYTATAHCGTVPAPNNCGENKNEACCENPDFCRHRLHSWHYGSICNIIKGFRPKEFSYAVEIKDQHKLSDLMDSITACGGQTVPDKDHIAIIVQGIINITNPEESCPE